MTTKEALEALCDSYELEIYTLDSAIQRVRELALELGSSNLVTDIRIAKDIFEALDGEQ